MILIILKITSKKGKHMTETIYCNSLEEYIRQIIKDELTSSNHKKNIKLVKKFTYSKRGRPPKKLVL